MRIFCPFLLFLAISAQAQQVQWLSGSPVEYDINPDIPHHFICASDVDHLYVARATTLTYLYGSVYGAAVVEQRNAQGGVNWTFTLGDSLQVQSMASDANGRVILGGRFFRRVDLNGDAFLPVVNGTEFPETFLLALDIDGELLWQRNITPNDPQGTEVQSITFDPQGHGWYATCDFFNAEIKQLDDLGNDVETRQLEDAKTIGSISFDPWGGLYVSGAAESPGLSVNGTFFPVGASYNLFVTRMGRNGDAQWLQSGNDITFQRPLVLADAFGHAYLAGSPFDSLTIGGIHFHRPEWNNTFFLARLDSTGAFLWGYQPPIGAPFSGQFTLAGNASLGVNADGSAVLLGIANGIIEWGNNVVTDIGSIQDRGVTLLELDSTGTPLWQLNGGSADYDVPQGLSVLPEGTCHLAAQVRDTFQLGPFTVETSDPTLVVARIDPSGPTNVANSDAIRDDVLAFPSPFRSSFSITGSDLERPARIRVRDATGRLVTTSSSVEGLGTSLAAGTYLVEVVQGARTTNLRVVKE